MKESIHAYFKVGTLQWMSFPESDPIESLRLLAQDDYFDVIETKGYDTPEQTERARRLLEQSHLEVSYGMHPKLLGQGLNPNAVDEDQRLKAEKVMLAAVDEARQLGAAGVSFLAGHWSVEDREKNYAQLMKTTLNLCRYAAEREMGVELEVFDYDVDKASLMGPAPYVARFAAQVCEQCHNFGILVDLSHIPITHEEPRFVIRTLRPYITHFHYGNAVIKRGCDAYGDKHPRLGYPNGENDVEQLAAFLRVLKEEGFFCKEKPYILSSEVTIRPGEEEGIVLANTKRCLNRAWALVED